MNIAFICGSLEPGKDGVGDYLRHLSLELLQKGHKVSLIAIHDPFVLEDSLEPQDTVDLTFSIIRLPRVNAHSLELFLLRTWLIKFNPDLISLHFVPFSFHTKGLSLQLAKKLHYIGGKRNWHIMFHELWLGMEKQDPLKKIIWGNLQRWLIKQLLRQLKPQLVTTPTPLYQWHLKNIGYKAAIFPLFSNIPVSAPYPVEAITQQQQLADEKQQAAATVINARFSTPKQQIARNENEMDPMENQLDQEKSRVRRSLDFVVFGTINKDAPFAAFTKEARAYADQQQLPISLTFIGRCGPEMGNWVAIWSEAGMEFKVLGEQPERIISAELRKASFGLCSTPLVLVEKSGSVAAMRAHALPVIGIAKPWEPVGMPQLDLAADVREYQPGRFNACIEQPLHAAPVFQVSDAADLLIKYTLT